MTIRRPSRSLLIARPLVAAATLGLRGVAQDPPVGDPLIAGFKSTYPASVSDAVELVIAHRVEHRRRIWHRDGA